MIRVKNHHTPPTIRPDRDLERGQMEAEVRGENGEDRQEEKEKKGDVWEKQG